MRPPESFLGQPIRDLQTMLRVISKVRYENCPLIPDGIYGQETAHAVAAFQKSHGLPVTGVTDQATWEAIWEAYVPARIHQEPACPLHPIWNRNQIIRKGERHAHLFLVQGILAVLSRRFSSICLPSFTGLLDDETEQSLLSFQGLCGLPRTGTVDKITWKYLALTYPLAASLDSMEKP